MNSNHHDALTIEPELAELIDEVVVPALIDRILNESREVTNDVTRECFLIRPDVRYHDSGKNPADSPAD
jgi:hypothetical protein